MINGTPSRFNQSDRTLDEILGDPEIIGGHDVFGANIRKVTPGPVYPREVHRKPITYKFYFKKFDLSDPEDKEEYCTLKSAAYSGRLILEAENKILVKEKKMYNNGTFEETYKLLVWVSFLSPEKVI